MSKELTETPPKEKPRISSRILSLDLMRGWFLIIIILDHLSYFPNGMSFITGDSRLFVSAAEGFFIVSGLVLGIVRGAKLIDKPMSLVTKKLWWRALTLYLTSIVVVILSIIFSWQFIGNSGVKSPIPPTDSNLLDLLWRIITLQVFYGWADYLRLYAIFIFVAPLFVWLLRINKWYIGIAISLIIWAFAPRPINPATQFFTWQLLFFVALTIGFYLTTIRLWWRDLAQKTRQRLYVTIMSAFLLTLSFNVISEFITPAFSGVVATAVTDARLALAPLFDKLNMPLTRLALSLLWFVGFYFVFRRFEAKITKYFGWILIPFGTNSLYVYTMHAVVITVMHLFVNPMYGNPASYLTSFDRIAEIPFNFFLSILGIAIIYLAVKTKFLMRIIPR